MKFSLGTVLTIADDRLMCSVGELYEILNYMTNDDLFTHQLSRAQRECQPYIIKQFPFLQEYVDTIAPQINRDNYKKILDDCCAKWGNELDVEPIPLDDHSRRDPVAELTQMMDGKDKIIVINPDKEVNDE